MVPFLTHRFHARSASRARQYRPALAVMGLAGKQGWLNLRVPSPEVKRTLRYTKSRNPNVPICARAAITLSTAASRDLREISEGLSDPSGSARGTALQRAE